MQSLIIHMSSSHTRRSNADRLLQVLPNARLVEAVDGRDPAQVAGFTTHPGTLHAPHYPFALTPGEVGCFLSHRKCWEMIAKGEADFTLIVEDDLAIDAALWPNVMTLIDRHADQDSFVRIPAKDRETPAHDLDSIGSVRLFLPQVIGLQTICQVVGRNAARRLLDATRQIDRPVDTFLQMHWITGQPIHTILPNGIAELTAQTGGSTIQQKTRTSGKLVREIKRAVYRARVKRRPQRA